LDERATREVDAVALPTPYRGEVDHHRTHTDQYNRSGKDIRLLPRFDEPVLGVLEESHMTIKC
jgi:hypothetical protein